MKIDIERQPNTSITEPLSFDLESYTIFAGENNSGKTHLIKAVKEHKNLKDFKVIYIPAERIQPQSKEASASAKTGAFFKVLDSILKPIFNKGILKDLVQNFNDSQDRKDFVENVNVILKDFGVNKKEFNVKINEDEFNKDLIIKIAKAFVKDLHQNGVEEVDFESIGMGTQRLIVAALIKYYEEKDIDQDKEVLIIFEEPEAYLHPKWKESLYNSLYKLSQKGKKVLITTHDPYFIELGEQQTIYKVSRDSRKKDATWLDKIDNKKVLPYKSHPGINYQIFGVPTEAYFLELYEYAKRSTLVKILSKNEGDKYLYVDFDNDMFKNYFKAKKVLQDCKDDNNADVTSMTRMRHNIAHYKNERCTMNTKDAIDNMVDFLEDYLKI